MISLNDRSRQQIRYDKGVFCPSCFNESIEFIEDPVGHNPIFGAMFASGAVNRASPCPVGIGEKVNICSKCCQAGKNLAEKIAKDPECSNDLITKLIKFQNERIVQLSTVGAVQSEKDQRDARIVNAVCRQLLLFGFCEMSSLWSEFEFYTDKRFSKSFYNFSKYVQNLWNTFDANSTQVKLVGKGLKSGSKSKNMDASDKIFQYTGMRGGDLGAMITKICQSDAALKDLAGLLTKECKIYALASSNKDSYYDDIELDQGDDDDDKPLTIEEATIAFLTSDSCPILR